MEISNYIILTRKEHKKFHDFKKFLEIIGLNENDLLSRLNNLEKENKELKQKVLVLEKALNSQEEYYKNYINERLDTLVLNIRKNLQETTKNTLSVMQASFKGNKINENI